MNELEYITQLQRTIFDLDNMIAYAWRVRKYFTNCTVAIDIGCGIGYQTAEISKLLPNTHFIMLDKDGVQDSINYSKTGYAHNNLELTKQYTKNHVNGKVYNIEKYNWNHAAQVVYSTLSWGWHYPIDVYLNRVLEIKPDYIILDTRNKVNIENYQIVDSFRINRKESTVVFGRKQLNETKTDNI
jgi:hypothetical protein